MYQFGTTYIDFRHELVINVSNESLSIKGNAYGTMHITSSLGILKFPFTKITKGLSERKP